MSEKIVLIDGHSILSRAFFGIPDLTNSEGLHTNAVYGFLNIMLKILEEEKPDYLTVAFDVHAPTFRHKMFDAYKGTRKPMAPELREQVPLMKDVLHAMGIVTVEKAGYEADDLLGTIGKRCEAEGLEVVIVSGDRDLLQLATEHIEIRIPKTKRGGTEIENYYAADVKERYQVTPEEFIDVKALMGDSSDNIPGVPGIGEKTATNLIVTYQTIENAYAHVDEIKPPRAQNALREHYDMAQMSKVLATIDTNAEITYERKDAALQNLFTPEAYTYFKRLEFKNLLSRFEVETPSDPAEQHFKTITMLDEAEDFFKETLELLQQSEREAAGEMHQLAVAVIQDGTQFFGFSFCVSAQQTVFVKAEGFLTEEYLKDKTAQLLQEAGEIVTPDLKAILKYIPLTDETNCFDTTVAAYLLDPLKSEYPYDDLAKNYMGLLTVPSQADLLGKQKIAAAEKDAPEKLAELACYESYIAWSVKPILQEKLKESGMWNLFCDVEMPLVFTLAQMEKKRVSAPMQKLYKTIVNSWGAVSQNWSGRFMSRQEKNLTSILQSSLGVILFEKLQMPNGKKTKTGYSTAASVLEKLAPDYPIVSDILEYRQLAKLKSTYADGLVTYISEDGRIHGTFNQTITATGRISSTEPNLQNIPIRMELGRMIRKVFLPKDGYVFLDADYSQIELRVLAAHMSGDRNLIDAYRHAEDIHRMTASQVFHTPLEEVTDQQRRNAKAVNFGIVYGISSFGLSQGLSITRRSTGIY